MESARLDLWPGVVGALHDDGGGGVARLEARRICSTAPAAVAVAAVAAAPPALESPLLAQSKPRGTLYIVGGGPQPPARVQEFVELAGGRGKARIVVFAMASESGLTGGEEKA